MIMLLRIPQGRIHVANLPVLDQWPILHTAEAMELVGLKLPVVPGDEKNRNTTKTRVHINKKKLKKLAPGCYWFHVHSCMYTQQT